jgi:hypothetical protein
MRDGASGQETGDGADLDETVLCSAGKGGWALDLTSIVLVLMALARL